MSVFKKLLDYIKREPGPHRTSIMAKNIGANTNTCRRVMGEMRQIGMAQIVGNHSSESLWQYVEQKPEIVEVEKIVEVQKTVFLQSAGEGETSIDSLARQNAIAERFIKAHNSGYTRKKRG